MFERFRNEHITNEDRADQGIARGDIAEAEAYLDAIIRKNVHWNTLHHAFLKKSALSLHEIVRGDAEKDPRIYDEANAIYGELGEMLSNELHDRHAIDGQRIGRVSELIAFMLPLRAPIDETTPLFMVPAPRKDDKAGIDFYVIGRNMTKLKNGWPIQIKTSATQEDVVRYTNSRTTLISMDSLDPFAGDPDHEASLAQRMLRELDGKATPEDIAVLNSASAALYEKILQENQGMHRRSQALFYAALQLIQHEEMPVAA
ncbi:hypothetical protein PV379_01890 [Streptomyces caniscabiei]|uniref:hypothetical protein n=1 Tax=Streptomyces caniscabiei TaxID=2746961 RepID=UPI0029B2B9F4|nr:hypothetical protein [Streptomyces caniscabiei]MDX2776105.1 hypothetical protein [Streptomyces caniscabiei]